MSAQLIAKVLLKTNVCSLTCKKGQSYVGYFTSSYTFDNTLQPMKSRCMM